MRCAGFKFNVEGIGWVIRECKDEVRLGITRELSAWSLVTGRSRVDGRTKDEWSLSEGAIFVLVVLIDERKKRVAVVIDDSGDEK